MPSGELLLPRLDADGKPHVNLREVFHLAAPLMVTNAVQALLNLTDLWFIGRISTDAVAAMSAIYWIVTCAILLFGGVGLAVQTFVAQAHGSRRRARASSALWSALWASITLIPLFLGLAFAGTGVLYPFFGTMLGWLGVALTGSDTSSNVLFGSLQRITAEQLSLSPVLMAAANSSGGVMGKMIDAQSIVVASTATRWYGHEGVILRYVFWHSLALASLVGGLVLLQAYMWPFSRLVEW